MDWNDEVRPFPSKVGVVERGGSFVAGLTNTNNGVPSIFAVNFPDPSTAYRLLFSVRTRVTVLWGVIHRAEW